MDLRTPLDQTARTALTIEFVARPDDTGRLRKAILAGVRERIEQVPGCVGCMVMIADREARLVSVVTFWTGTEQTVHSGKGARQIRKLLVPYVDRYLRIRTLEAYLSMQSSAWATTMESSPQGKTSSAAELPLRVA